MAYTRLGAMDVFREKVRLMPLSSLSIRSQAFWSEGEGNWALRAAMRLSGSSCSDQWSRSFFLRLRERSSRVARSTQPVKINMTIVVFTKCFQSQLCFYRKTQGNPALSVVICRVGSVPKGFYRGLRILLKIFFSSTNPSHTSLSFTFDTCLLNSRTVNPNFLKSASRSLLCQ